MEEREGGIKRQRKHLQNHVCRKDFCLDRETTEDRDQNLGDNINHLSAKDTELWREFMISVNSRLADTPLLRTLAITGKIQIPGESCRGLARNGMASAFTSSRYYGITDTFVGTERTILLFWLSIKRTL